jgi:hypothetical protein
MRNSYKILVGKPEGKMPSGRRRHTWEDNIKIDLVEIGLETENGFIWLRIRTCGVLCKHRNEDSDSIKEWGFLDWLSVCLYNCFSRRRNVLHGVSFFSSKLAASQ